MPPIITRNYQSQVIQTIKELSRSNRWWSSPINLGGVPGSGGGSGEPVGGIFGQLIQTKVAYDTSEAAYSGIMTNVPSGSLVDNLAHMRYNLKAPSFVTVSGENYLDNERVLTAGESITIEDGGSNGNVTVIGTLERIGNSTYRTIQEMHNQFHSAGWVSGGIVTTSGTLVTVSSGTGFIRATDDTISTIFNFDWEGDSFNIPTNEIKYIGAEYNSGSPQLVARDDDGDFDNNTAFAIVSVVNEDDNLHIAQHRQTVGDHAGKMIERMHDTMHIERANREGGLILGETGTRNITMSSGAVWIGLDRIGINAFDSSSGDTFDRYYRDGVGGFTKQSAQTQWNNTQYDDGTGTLATINNNFYSVQYFYLELDSEIVSLFGQNQYNQLGDAFEDTAPSDIPARITEHGTLIGRLIFQESAVTAEEIQTVFAEFSSGGGGGGTGVSDHGALSGLGDDDHTQYLLVDGTRNMTGDLEFDSPQGVLFPDFYISDGGIEFENAFTTSIGFKNAAGNLSGTEGAFIYMSATDDLLIINRESGVGDSIQLQIAPTVIFSAGVDPAQVNRSQYDFYIGDTQGGKMSLGGEVVFWGNVSGEENVINSANRNIDTSIATEGSSFAIFVDADADSVGMFNNNPVYQLDVTGTLNASVGLLTNGGGLQVGGPALDEAISSGEVYWDSAGSAIVVTSRTSTGSPRGVELRGNGISWQVYSATAASFSEYLEVNPDNGAGGRIYFNIDAEDADFIVDGTTQTIMTLDAGLDAFRLYDGNLFDARNTGFVFNESGADRDFRIESDDNANMFFIDGGTDKVGIGTSTPGTATSTINTLLDVVLNLNTAVDARGPFIEIRGYNAGGSSSVGIVFIAARGSESSPSATQSGDIVFNFSGTGYGATAYPSLVRCNMIALATENWTDSAHGNRMLMQTVVTGSSSRTTKLEIDGSGHILPGSAASQNLGSASLYWNVVNYKVLTDRGCLGWYDEGVELLDGRVVSDIDALKEIKVHPEKMTVHGSRMLDYTTMPKHVYSPAPVADEDVYDVDVDTQEKTLKYKTGEVMGDEGANVDALISIMIGAIKELSNEVESLKAQLNVL